MSKSSAFAQGSQGLLRVFCVSPPYHTYQVWICVDTICPIDRQVKGDLDGEALNISIGLDDYEDLKLNM